MKNTLQTGLAIALSTSTLAAGCGAENPDISYDGCDPLAAKAELQSYVDEGTTFEGLTLEYKYNEKPNGDNLLVRITDETTRRRVDDPLVLKCGQQVVAYAGLDPRNNVQLIPAASAEVAIEDDESRDDYSVQLATRQRTIYAGKIEGEVTLHTPAYDPHDISKDVAIFGVMGYFRPKDDKDRPQQNTINITNARKSHIVYHSNGSRTYTVTNTGNELIEGNRATDACDSDHNLVSSVEYRGLGNRVDNEDYPADACDDGRLVVRDFDE